MRTANRLLTGLGARLFASQAGALLKALPERS